MNPSNNSTLGEVPADQRRRILVGMRWTVWLSFLSLPFSAATTVMLGRSGAEVLGTYGLLSVYIGFVSSFLFLGGDAVAINFIPQCPREKRVSFFITYLLIACAITVPWLFVAILWPGAIERLIGHNDGPRFNVLIFCLAPLQIGYTLLAASFKGMLEIRKAQALYRVIPIGSFLLYAALFVFDRRALQTDSALSVWAIYLGLIVASVAIGFKYFVRLNGWGHTLVPRPFLPAGFWRYALATQLVSMANFVMSRLDYILVLNLAGVRMLGQYVMVVTVATLIQQIGNYFLDTLLPSLTNLIATRNHAAAGQVFFVHMRILFAVDAAVCCALMLFAFPVTSMVGPEYSAVYRLIILGALFQGLSSPGLVGGTLLASIGKQQRASGVVMLQFLVFISAFALLWPRLHLLGAVLAYGLASLLANIVLLAVGRHAASIYPSVGRMYLTLPVVLLPVAAASIGMAPLSLVGACLIWVAAIVAYLLIAGYDSATCLTLLRYFLPTAVARWLRLDAASHARETLQAEYAAAGGTVNRP